MVIAIARHLGEAKDESTSLRPMTIIGMEIMTILMIGVAIATQAAPKRRNAEVLRPRRKSAAGVIASLRVVIIRLRRGGITVIAIAIVTTTTLRVLRETGKSRTTTLRKSSDLQVEEIIVTTGVMKLAQKKICNPHHVRRINETFSIMNQRQDSTRYHDEAEKTVFQLCCTSFSIMSSVLQDNNILA